MKLNGIIDVEFANLQNRHISKKLFKRTCEANAAGENSSFIFIVCVKSVSLYHFELAYVVLHMAVKEFFKTRF